MPDRGTSISRRVIILTPLSYLGYVSLSWLGGMFLGWLIWGI